jgi:hypothetical protein
MITTVEQQEIGEGYIEISAYVLLASRSFSSEPLVWKAKGLTRRHEADVRGYLSDLEAAKFFGAGIEI